MFLIWSSLSLTYNQVLWNSVYLDIDSFVLGQKERVGIYSIIYSDETHRLWTDKLPVQGRKETVRIKICSLAHQTLVLKTVKLEDDNKTLEILSMTVAENNLKLSLSEKVWQGEKCEKQLQDILFTTPLHARQPNWNIWGWNSSFQ